MNPVLPETINELCLRCRESFLATSAFPETHGVRMCPVAIGGGRPAHTCEAHRSRP